MPVKPASLVALGLSAVLLLSVGLSLANDPRLQWVHVLQPGEAMLFDNWRVLHGRKAYSGTRTLCGAYLNHEDFESRLRRGV